MVNVVMLMVCVVSFSLNAMEVADESKKLLGDIELMRLQHEKTQEQQSETSFKAQSALSETLGMEKKSVKKSKKSDTLFLLPCGGITGGAIGAIPGIPLMCTHHLFAGCITMMAGMVTGLLVGTVAACYLAKDDEES